MKRSSLSNLYDYANIWSIAGMFGAILVVAFITGFNPLTYFNDIPQLISSPASAALMTTPYQMAITVIHGVAMLICTVFVAAAILPLILNAGKIEESVSLRSVFAHGPMVFYLLIIGEELVFRQLFLGWIRTLLGSDPIITIVLIVISTTVFALFHLKNYKPGYRPVSLVLSQFLLGLVLSFIFLKFGFWITLLTHLSYDAAAFSIDKSQKAFGRDLFGILYWSLLALIAFTYMNASGIHLSALNTWLNATSISALSINAWQTAVLIVFLNSLFSLGSSMLFLDDVETTKDFRQSFIQMTVIYFITAMAMILVIYLINWIVGLVITASLLRAFLIVILLTLMITMANTGSKVTSLWWFGLPISYLEILVILAFPFWSAVSILTINFMAGYIPTLVSYRHQFGY